MKISDLSAFIFDLDGVVWRGATPVEGAVESIAQLRAAGKRCFYCTNNASALPAAFGERLRAMGIEAEDADVMTSSTATALYLASQFTGQFSAFVVGEEGLVAALRKVGARVVTMQDGNEIDEANFPVDCVVAGIDRTFNYAKLRIAQQCVLQGARFVATNRDATFPVEGGVAPGAGSIISAIETASGTTPLTIGKPQPLMANLLIHQFGLKPETTAMIGDRLDTDIVFARRARIAALFVATGVSTREEATTARRDFKPDAIFDDLPALCQAVLGAPSTPHMSTHAAPSDTTITPIAADATTASVASASVASASAATASAASAPVDSASTAFSPAPIEESASVESDSSQSAPQESVSSIGNTVQSAPDETGKSAFDAGFSFELPGQNEASAATPNNASPTVDAASADVADVDDGATTSGFSLASETPISQAQVPQAQVPQAPVPQSVAAESDAALFSFGDEPDTGAAPVPNAGTSTPVSASVVETSIFTPAPPDAAAPVAVATPNIEAAPVVEVIATPDAPPADEKVTDNWWESMDDIFTDPAQAKKTPGA